MSEPLTIIARFRAKAGQQSRLREELQRLVAPKRAEAGCTNYDLHQAQNDPRFFLFYENWTSQAALDAHFQTPHLQALLKRVPDLVDEPPEITKWTIVK